MPRSWPGSAKAVFAGQFLGEGVRRGQPGVFVTLEEPAADLRPDLRPDLRISGLNDTVVGRYAESDNALKRGVLVLER